MAISLAKDWKLGVGGSYNTIAYQRDGTMTLAQAVVDSTNKDSSNERSLLAGVHSWTFNSAGLIDESDTGFGVLWTSWNTKATMAGRFTTPATNTYTGTTLLANVTYSGPYNDNFVFNLTAEGTSTLAKA